MATTPRGTEQRIADALARLAGEVDCWVPSAGADGDAYLIPLSFLWHEGRIIMATPADSRTARNLRRAGRARVALDGTRDVVLVEGELSFVAAGELAPDLADRFAAAVGFDPRLASGDYRYIILSPRLIQAWRSVGELAGRAIMRDGRWQG